MTDHAAEIDPRPFVWPNGTRSAFPLGVVMAMTFAPRPEYAQDWAAYDPHMVSLPLTPTTPNQEQ